MHTTHPNRKAAKPGRSATAPVIPDLATKPLSTLVPRYECPSCESCVPPGCAQSKLHGDLGDRKTVCIACPRCGKRHKADFLLVFDNWQQVSETVPVAKSAELEPETQDAFDLAEVLPV